MNASIGTPYYAHSPVGSGHGNCSRGPRSAPSRSPTTRAIHTGAAPGTRRTSARAAARHRAHRDPETARSSPGNPRIARSARTPQTALDPRQTPAPHAPAPPARPARGPPARAARSHRTTAADHPRPPRPQPSSPMSVSTTQTLRSPASPARSTRFPRPAVPGRVQATLRVQAVRHFRVHQSVATNYVNTINRRGPIHLHPHLN